MSEICTNSDSSKENEPKSPNGFSEKLPDWNSSRQSWEENKDVDLKTSEPSSGDESPPSDIPASSSISNTTNALEFFVQAIEKNEVTEKPNLETQLKILRWMRNCSKDDKVSSKYFLPSTSNRNLRGAIYLLLPKAVKKK